MANKENKSYCSNCKTETNQEILFKDKELYTSEVIIRDDSGVDKKSVWIIEAAIWQIFKCQGCNRLNFKITTKHITEEGLKTIRELFIPQKNELRAMPKWIMELPIKYVEIFFETYSAINQNLFRLALMGSRLIIETFILEKIGDVGTFKEKLNALVKNGFVGERQKKILANSLDAGNAASHRAFKPEKDIINKVMDTIEHLIYMEILERNSAEIKNATPERGKKL